RLSDAHDNTARIVDYTTCCAGSTALPAEDMDDRLVKLMESSTEATSVTKQYTAEDKKIKGAILAHYSQTSDHEL
ncbi:hypothetical protein, partial [Klebsiella pneumoniae]|uniref:hypothetical protein n=1 Tax=Klebsiella pneumoniae TaxID=573 RepID=UPI0040557487